MHIFAYFTFYILHLEVDHPVVEADDHSMVASRSYRKLFKMVYLVIGAGAPNEKHGKMAVEPESTSM